MLDQLSEEIDVKETDAMKMFYKKISIRAGIFCGILVVFFGLLVTLSLVSRKSWRTGLRSEIGKVFLLNSISEYSVGEYVKVNSGMTVNCAVYKLNSVEDNKKSYDYAVIIRVPTLYGPMAAVYLFSRSNGNVIFVDFAQLDVPVSKSVKNSSMNSQIAYWAGKIPAIVNNLDAGAKGVK
ncbi:MAG: hypothetical protein MST12_04440 [Spirochaetia bacterium]|nr:hypothetical protein [uncultured Treponema sp.]MCI7577483.1 hypothetical protein [Spirochaetia bacterium]